MSRVEIEGILLDRAAYLKAGTRLERVLAELTNPNPKRMTPGYAGQVKWTGSTMSRGRGGFKLNGQMEVSSRAAWLLFVGSIPPGQCVCHRCDNRLCVNFFDHLFLGTKAENNEDKRLKRRHVYGETHPNAQLTEKDVEEILLRASCGESNAQIARAFKVRHKLIWRVVRRETWRHV